MPEIYLKTKFKPVLVEWEADKINSIELTENSVVNTTTIPNSFPFPELIDYFAGESVDFNDYQLDLTDYPPFSRIVLETCRKIPYGELISYSELAGRCANPKACQAVGNALGKNRYPIIIPCHRVIGSADQLGGFSAGSAWKEFLINWERQHR